MQILYNGKTDLLYIRLDDQGQPVINRRVSEDVILDIGEGDRIVDIAKRLPGRADLSRGGAPCCWARRSRSRRN